jgi:hypothetical protein
MKTLERDMLAALNKAYDNPNISVNALNELEFKLAIIQAALWDMQGA